MGSGGKNRKRSMTLEDLPCLDIAKLRRSIKLGVTSRTTWQPAGEAVANLIISATNVHVRFCNTADGDQLINLLWCPCQLGGHRAYWVCPLCQKPASKLYLSKSLHCRKCSKLTYISQRSRGISRAGQQANKAFARIGGHVFNIPDKPKGMHWRTYHRYLLKAHEPMMRLNTLFMADTALLNEELKKLGLDPI